VEGERNLSHYRARYYDFNTGRFLGEDPIGFNGGVNFYRYVRNNPILLIDPFGLGALSLDQIANLVAQYNRSGQSNELIICMIFKESTFNPDADRPKGSARGLMGVTGDVADELGANYEQLHDPALNIRIGTQYLHRRIDWKNYANGNVRNGLAGYGEGGAYADSLLQCEKCMKKDANEGAECKTKECLLPLHGGK
jgi:uncharacterized protein RhaS with RHS repeats